MSAEAIRNQIMALVAQYAALKHAPQPFRPGVDRIPVSGRVYDADDMQHLVDSGLDFWLTTGRFNATFEHKLAQRLGTRFALTVNSGSSANLVALTALTSPLLKDLALQPGDEVITCATGFPTTINPILQNGLVPVFCDVELGTYNINVDAMAAAITPKTRAIMIAHALGNPFDLGAVMALAKAHNLHVVEDCCDALGASYAGQPVGTFGAFGTLSFYPAHHITMGEGGAVFTANPIYKRAAESIRDWGRDCWCAPGADNTCGNRFNQQLGQLPFGYDHKYSYAHLGYNLKITDMQAAVGVAQLGKLDGFIAKRRHNFERLLAGLKDLEHHFILPVATPNSEPSWFGFALTVRDNSPLDRAAILQGLNEARIDTRLLFGGNLVKQPYMQGRAYRVAGDLAQADTVMTSTFWVGVYPGLSDAQIDYMIEVFHNLCP